MAVHAGADPDAECQGESTCNGLGKCTLADGKVCTADNECVSGICVDGVCCQDACSGLCLACNVWPSYGQCKPVHAGTDPAHECPGTCNGAGACTLANGAPCSAGKECTSGHCVDGVCCASWCWSLCHACNLPGSVGSCAAIPAGSDPAKECPGDSTCNGAGACTP